MSTMNGGNVGRGLAILALLLVGLTRPWSGAGAVVPDARHSATAAIPAPELVGDTWLNLPKGTNITIASRKGKVTIVHFWTFGCINCKRNLPLYQEWQKRFTLQGVQIIGIHTPETEAEKDPANVVKKVKEYHITYPVLIDKDAENWNRWQQRYWPAVYLVDKRGRVRYAWEGELEYQKAGGNAKMTSLIESLLRE